MENKKPQKKHCNLFYIIRENIEKMHIPIQIYNELLLLVIGKTGYNYIANEGEEDER